MTGREPELVNLGVMSNLAVAETVLNYIWFLTAYMVRETGDPWRNPSQPLLHISMVRSEKPMPGEIP